MYEVSANIGSCKRMSFAEMMSCMSVFLKTSDLITCSDKVL